MSDEGMDPCECIWGHELAMRRLLNVIRNSQSTCIDNECFEDGFRNGGLDQNPFASTFFLIAMVVVMYYFRPKFQRIHHAAKPNNGGNGAPPTPPPAMF